MERPTAFKALDDVSFTVEEGEVVGIIGHNGAGKSTLLKLLSRITVPTSGRVAVKGKVAPLIEVGAGLIGEMTGRENIYLNGAILGMSQRELRKKFDEIVAFAELERFIDTPLKRYSSGMQVRLGFAVATSVEADVLIVDEVLAVGDMAFQRKCFDRMERLIKGMGKTVLLVSHNIRQVERMSTRAMLLSGGRIAAMGDTQARLQPLLRAKRREDPGRCGAGEQDRSRRAASKPPVRHPSSTCDWWTVPGARSKPCIPTTTFQSSSRSKRVKRSDTPCSQRASIRRISSMSRHSAARARTFRKGSNPGATR